MPVFEGQVHAFMAPVLLRIARLDALDLDTEAQPPDGQPAEIEQCVSGGERHAVVRADGVWQAAFLEQAFKGGKSQLLPRGFKGFAQQQVARGMIGDGQRIAVFLLPSRNSPL